VKAAAVDAAGLEEFFLCNQASLLILRLSLSGRFLPCFEVVLAAAAAVDGALQNRLVSTNPPTVLYTSLAAIPLATHVLNI
jgi:hypothetical protein